MHRITFILTLGMCVHASAADYRRVMSSTGITYIEIPGDTFIIGRQGGESDGRPVKVSLTKFWISETEVSWRQVKSVLGESLASSLAGVAISDEMLDFPAVGIDYFKLKRVFFPFLTSRENEDGKLPHGVALLPTEAQWVYVARSGGGEMDESKEAITRRVLESNENFDFPRVAPPQGVWRCGTGHANAFGCRDMLGNVAEMCRDVYYGEILGGTDPAQLTCINVWDDLKTVVRGGSYLSSVDSAALSFRTSVVAPSSAHTLGFRVVWEVRDNMTAPIQSISEKAPDGEKPNDHEAPSGNSR